eukprot:COSAG02_NODE_1994_length_10160_cov_84.117483_4_plen_90_part_00
MTDWQVLTSLKIARNHRSAKLSSYCSFGLRAPACFYNGSKFRLRCAQRIAVTRVHRYGDLLTLSVPEGTRTGHVLIRLAWNTCSTDRFQ